MAALLTSSTDLHESSNLPVSVNLSIPFDSPELALVAFNSLRVDREPKRGSCSKVLSVDHNFLNVQLVASETRQLRTALNSFMDHLLLVSKTIDVFGSEFH